MPSSAIVDGLIQLMIPVGAQTLSVRYRPWMIPPQFQVALSYAVPFRAADSMLYTMLSHIIESWDLADDDLQVYALDVGTLQIVPDTALLFVLRAISVDAGLRGL
jgi:hypothetical protein